MSARVYVCACGNESPTLTGGQHHPKDARYAVRVYGQADPAAGCAGQETACYVCGNCGQWARPTHTPRAIVWDCVNECAARGFAQSHRKTI